LEDISLHVLDVVENSLSAQARTVSIRIVDDAQRNVITVEIEDDGRGMDEATARRALDPFYTTKKTRRVGLGLPMLAQSARESGGGIEIRSAVGKGTWVKATFQRNHPDCRPIGDMLKTLSTLVESHPQVNFVYEHTENGKTLRFDTRNGVVTNRIQPC